jgi:alpha-L-fucosidase
MKLPQLLKELAETVRWVEAQIQWPNTTFFLHSCGGNLLMNVGPTRDGRIMPIFEEQLRQFGDWMKVNGESIYGSKPWAHQNDTVGQDVW